MSSFLQLDSISERNFIQLNFCESDYLCGEEGDGMKAQYIFPGSDRRSKLVRVFLLEVCDWLKGRKHFDWLANDVGDSWIVSVSGRSNTAGKLMNDWKFDDRGL